MSDDRQHESEPERAQSLLARAFRGQMSAAEAEAPSFDDVAAYVEGRLAGDALALFEARLSGDALLRDEVEDLRALRREMTDARPAAAPAWTRWAAAAAVLAGLGGGWLWMRDAHAPATGTAQSGGAPDPVSPPAAIARVQDDSGPIVLLADGTVAGVAAELQARVADALRSGTLRVPALRKDLAVSEVVSMGAAGPEPGFAPLGPLATLVLDDRPTLRWGRHAHGRAYVVSIYDLDLSPVAVSPELAATEWRPARPLPRGRTYTWQVEAITPAARETVPAPPAAEARFHVAAETVAIDTRAALAAAGGSRLAGAVVLAERGFRDEAARDLAALAARNPDSVEIRRLQERLAPQPAR